MKNSFVEFTIWFYELRINYKDKNKVRKDNYYGK